MPEPQRELAITRVAFLELKDEQRLVQEGYELLDEKRILLAAEIHRQLVRLRTLRTKSRAAQRTARDATIAALGCHGLDELSVYPPLSTGDDRLNVTRSRLLGLELIDARLDAAASQNSEQPVNPTPEARNCALAHRAWLAIAVELASCSVNLRRLVREYVRTERRARAIENILLPEIGSALKLIDEQLESMDHEEIARLRHRRAGWGLE
jgi:V/A-type H+-transporting ATPase subunit D